MNSGWFLPLVLSYLGTPYLYGGNTKLTGLDCSGLTQEILKAAGVNPPGDNNAQMLFDYFSKGGSYNVMKLGSLAFYGKSAAQISHVAVLVDDAYILEAGSGDHTTITLDDAIKKNALTRIRPLKHRQDLIAVIRPRYFWDI